ncbi:MAG: hypothetical protein ACYCZ8_11590 [Acidimicrobiales bacterium]
MADELVNGLDTDWSRWVRGLLWRLAAEGRMVFVLSPLMSEPPSTRGPIPPGRYGIEGVLASEWTKLKSVRSTVWTQLALGVLGALVLSAYYHGTDPFGPWTGFGLLCGYAAAALVVGGVLFVRRDA